MPFELRSPNGLWLLSLLGPLVLLYVLRIRRKRKRVPSTWLWAAAERDLLARHPFRRLRAEVPLLLESLAVVLFALALADPASRKAQFDAGHVALVLDTSASMTTLGDNKRSRFDEAREAALAVLRSLTPGTQVMVIDAGREPRIVSPLDRDRSRVEQALAKLSAHEVEGALGRAVAVASDHLRARSDKSRIIVFSDGAVADQEALTHSSLPLDLVTVGKPAENTAIIRTDITLGPDPATGRERVQVFGVVKHFGESRRELFVTLRQKDVAEPLSSRKLELMPGEQAPFVLAFDAAPGDAGTGLVVELSPADALVADDRAFLRVPAGSKLPVVLAPAKASPWIERALAADPNVEALRANDVNLSAADVPSDALVIIAGHCPRAIPGGDFMIVNPPAGECLGTVVGDLVERPTITSWADADPRFRFLSLEGVDVQRAHRLEPDSPKGALLRAREAVLVADVSVPGRTGTLIGFDPGETTWPLKASFVLFIRNVTELARAHRAGMVTGPQRTGEPLRVRVPPHVQEVEIEGPRGERLKVPAREGLVVAPSVDTAGFYFVTYPGGSTLIPVNLTSALESDITPRTLARPNASHSTSTKAPDGVTPLAWLLAALALLLLGADLYYLTREPRPLGSKGLPIRPERASS